MGNLVAALGPEVVIWQADGVVDGQRGYGAPIASRLATAGFGVSVVPLVERAPDRVELAAPVHVLSGGASPVDTDARWLREARAALAGLLERGLAGEAMVSGICFGAQLIASVLAGPAAVGPHPEGMQAGLVEVLRTDDLMVEVVSSFHYHGIDRASIEAAGARVLLTSSRTQVQAFAWGAGVLGLQFHPELAPDQLRATLLAHRRVVRAHGGAASRAAASIVEREQWWSESPWDRFVLTPARRMIGAPSAGAVAA